MARLSELLEKLAEHGGTIVSTNELTEFEIAKAVGENRMFTNDDSLGYVWVGKKVDTSDNGLHLQNVTNSYCGKEGEENMKAEIKEIIHACGSRFEFHRLVEDAKAELDEDAFDSYQESKLKDL